MSKQNRFDAPAIVHMDDLALYTDDDLGSLAHRLEQGRQRSRNAVPWEVEIAYVRREQQIRRRRAELHSEWVKVNGSELNEEFFTDEEA